MKTTCIFVITLLIIFIVACKTIFPVQKIDYDTSFTPDQLREGRKLVISMCGPCHYNPETKKLTGVQQYDLPKIAGKVYSRNITQDPEKGIADYTDGEIAYLIRTGISKTGRLMPYMQRPNLADADLKAIIIFLHSDDDLVTVSKTEPPVTRYNAFGRFGINHFPGPLKYPDHTIAKPEVKANNTAYGKYLVDNLSCYHCHSKSFLTVNELEPEKSKGYMAGGNKLKDEDGKMVRSSNITFHETTGIGTWNEYDFKRALQDGVSKDGSPLSRIMPRYRELSETDIAAIFAYLGTVPKINHKTYFGD
jgi:hypothetical protein